MTDQNFKGAGKAIPLLVALAFSFNSTALAGGSEGVAFSSIDNGTSSGIEDKSNWLIRTDEEWKSFWRKHKATETPPEAAPRVNFKTDMVIAVFAGTKSSGGYTVKVVHVSHSDESIRVDALLNKPKRGSMNSQMMTQPYDIIKCRQLPGKLTVNWNE
ncbi:MAG: protease complex subunit PrcB family protein [Candidatus Obscuribacterales bacterium]|nr:protease complex subunit PrcB family protein [Candidatus Obscuribacterales bacterium]